jgi:polysaccharide chain length determinant protein (PEP-CTERM system associated)
VIPGKKYRPEDFLRVFISRKWLFIVPFVTVALTTATIVYFLPDRYVSRAIVQVAPPKIPADVVKPTRLSLETRLNNMQTRILSHTRLENLISEFNLYPRERQKDLMEDVVDRMLHDINVSVIRGNAFQVTYEAEDRVKAMRVTARLAQIFIDESALDKQLYTQSTSQFIDSQLEDTREKLVAHEKKLEEYRRQHAGELPSQLTSNLTAASNAQLQLQSLNDTLNRDRDRLQTLEREQNELMTQETVAPGVPAVADPDAGTGTAAQQLESARRQLRQMELRLKPEHPDMVRMKRVIADLEQKAEAEALQTPVSGSSHSSPAEKARQQRLAELKTGIESLRTQISRREHDIDGVRDMIARYQQRADNVPKSETELIEMNRDYDTLRQLYSDLLKKSQESKMAADLETRQIGERFSLLEAARAPERPVSPNRPQLNILGIAGGLVLGLAFVALAEYRDTSFKTDDDVLTSLALPVLAMIPNMVTHSERRVRRRRRVVMSVTAVLVALAAAVAATVVWFGWRA